MELSSSRTHQEFTCICNAVVTRESSNLAYQTLGYDHTHVSLLGIGSERVPLFPHECHGDVRVIHYMDWHHSIA